VNIEMTGYEDREGPWKVALCGPAGVGKTMFSSTAQSPLFVFFQQEPRIKSIAGRAVPHVKIVNDFSSGVYVMTQLESLLMWLKLSEHQYDTIVIDTGDELFQAMKASRTFQNGGEFGPGDWGWIGDTYREIMLSIIDLPMNVIVTFHTKLSQDEDGTYRELLLQGSAKDEAPGWFDIVGALDTFETVDESGLSLTRRVLVTASSRSYPWVKDHSGALPGRFFLSDGIVDDFPRLLGIVRQQPETGVSHSVVAEISTSPKVEVKSGAAVPSPEDLQNRKVSAKEEAEVNRPEPEEAPLQETLQVADATVAVPAATAPTTDTIEAQKPEQPVADGGPAETEGEGIINPSTASDDTPTLDEAAGVLEEKLDAVEVFVCAECGIEVTDSDLRDLTQIRFRKYLCREHFKALTLQ